MRDPLTVLAEQAAAALGAEALAPVPTELSSAEVFAAMSRPEIEAALARLARLRSAGSESAAVEDIVPPEVLRRCALRRGLDVVGPVRFDEHGREAQGVDACLHRSRGCRCAEDAVVEAAAVVARVDPAAVRAVRARAEVLHRRLSRRLARARDRLRGPHVAAAVLERRSVREVAVALGTVGGPNVVAVRKAVSAPAVESVREPSRPRRSSSTAAHVSLRSPDQVGRELAFKLGLPFTMSTRSAVPIVDPPRGGADGG